MKVRESSETTEQQRALQDVFNRHLAPQVLSDRLDKLAKQYGADNVERAVAAWLAGRTAR